LQVSKKPHSVTLVNSDILQAHDLAYQCCVHGFESHPLWVV